jgi:hypothetical protein
MLTLRARTGGCPTTINAVEACIMAVGNAAERFGYNTSQFGLDVFLVFSLGIFYRVIAYSIMRWQDHKILRGQ